jgi:methylmalonyl-CoA mutase
MAGDSEDRLFNSFNPSNKSEWLAKVEAELGNDHISSLYNQLDDSIILDPFATNADLDSFFNPIAKAKEDNSWNIGASIQCENDKLKTNKALLKMLNMGVNAPELIFKSELDVRTLNAVFRDVKHEFVQTHIRLESAATSENSLKGLVDYISTINSLDTHFFLSYEDLDFPKSLLFQILENINKDKNRLRCIRFGQTKSEMQGSSITEHLTTLFTQVANYFDEAKSLNLSKDKIISLCYFEIEVGPKFLSEIANIRAVNILWQNMLKAFDLPKIDPQIVARIQHNNSEIHPLIATASTACSAILGGADTIFISAGVEKMTKNDGNFDIKLQHILKFENHLNRVVDPIAGSHFIEKLGNQIAEKVWQELTLV